MAEIALRAYVKEIDALIERDQLDEAISHCRHILQAYPKHLDSYRLLGKSYLEAKRFGDSADIFQRVLSAVPDDFVSQIGMAIVREDEGNMDAAIWHMERAYETNPANPAIRQELSRLIGRRDGLEPHKIRLTRGALARQYAQGELYPQAIAELRSALQEDPDRPDLRVLLAKMYWRSDQWEDATETCERILMKLPFCLEANRIMAAILQAEDRSVDASEYHRKIAALDPYYAFVESAATDPSTVDADTVKIERYEWTPGQPLPSTEPSQPEWVSSLGVDLSEESAEKEESSESPPWLAGVESTPSVGVGATPALVGAAAMKMNDQPTSEDDQIPEWMQEAGWAPSSGEAEEGPVSFSDDELEALDAGTPPPSEDTGELAPADIPNWLQDIAPESEEAAPAAPPEPEAEQPPSGTGMPAWLSDIAADAEDVAPDPSPSQPEAIPQVEAEPSEAEEPKADSEAESIEFTESSEVPTWVEDEAPGATSTIITWLGDKPGQEAGEPAADKTPEWLDDTSPQEVLPAEDELPTWMRESEDSPSEPSEVSEGIPASEEMPSWIRDTERESPTLPETEYKFDPATEPDLKPAQEAPSWLAGVAAAASEVEPEEEPEAEPATPQPDDEMSAEDVASLFRKSEPTEETPAWLSGVSASDVEAAAESPEWISEISDEPEDREQDQMPAPSWVDEGVTAPEEPSPEAAAPDWLQGIGEGDEAAPPVVERDVPEWLSGIAEPESAEAPSDDWLDDLRAAAPTDEAVSDPTSDEGEEDIFDVDALRRATTDAEEPDVSPAEPVGMPSGVGGATDVVDDDEVFNWLENLAESQEVPEQATPEVPPQPVISSSLEEPVQMADQAPPDEPDQGLDWLEDLASERSVEAEVVTTEPATMPDFSAAQPVTPAAEEAVEGETPGWLRDLADVPTEEPAVGERLPAEPPVVPTPVEEQPTPDQPDPGVEVPDWLLEPVPEAPPSPPTRPAVPPPAVSETPPAPPAEAPFEPVAPEAAEPIAPPQPAPPPPAAGPVSPPASTPPAPPPEKVKYKEPPTDKSLLLQDARQALSAGDAGRAISNYRKLIDRKQDLDIVIKDLEHASERYPNLPTMWQALGDAYMKADRLPEAIDAYQKGMEVA